MFALAVDAGERSVTVAADEHRVPGVSAAFGGELAGPAAAGLEEQLIARLQLRGIGFFQTAPGVGRAEAAGRVVAVERVQMIDRRTGGGETRLRQRAARLVNF